LYDDQTDTDDEDDTKDGLQPDPETLHTTDPQEKMKGPISSFMQGIKEEVEENDKETKEEADKKKKEGL
jgi:hypothetical protein